MSRVLPEPSRVSVRREGGRLVATVAVRRSRLAVGFLTTWLGGWASGVGLLAWHLLAGAGLLPVRAFMVVFLAGWTVAGLVVLRQAAWLAAGREEIAVDGRSLAIRWSAGPFGGSRAYDLAGVRNVREDATLARSRAGGFRLTAPGVNGALAFDYGGRTIRFGADVEGEDARKVLALVRERVPPAARAG